MVYSLGVIVLRASAGFSLIFSRAGVVGSCVSVRLLHTVSELVV